MNLTNPFTGASADLSVEFVKGNVIKFTKEGVSDNKKLTDTVELKLNGNKFTGVNSLTLQTISPAGGGDYKNSKCRICARWRKDFRNECIGKMRINYAKL